MTAARAWQRGGVTLAFREARTGQCGAIPLARFVVAERKPARGGDRHPRDEPPHCGNLALRFLQLPRCGEVAGQDSMGTHKAWVALHGAPAVVDTLLVAPGDEWRDRHLR